MAITITQLSQMVLACFIAFLCWTYKKNGVSCDVSDQQIISCFLIYLSFLILFANLFYQRYYVAGRKNVSKKSK